jgi:hypothetical protein
MADTQIILDSIIPVILVSDSGRKFFKYFWWGAKARLSGPGQLSLAMQLLSLSKTRPYKTEGRLRNIR